MDNARVDDIVFGIVEDYLREGPEYLDIVETVADEYEEEATDTELEKISLRVRWTLTNLARTFNLSNEEENN